MRAVIACLALALGAGCTSLDSLHDEVRFGDQGAAYELASFHDDAWRPQLREFLDGGGLADAGGARLACELPQNGAAYFSLVQRGDDWVCLCWAFAAEGEWGGFTPLAFEEDLGSAALAAYEDGALVVVPQIAESEVKGYTVLGHLRWDGTAFSME